MTLKRFYKKLICLILIFTMIFGIVGCGPNLTESESKEIAEYSAGLLLKYDKNYDGSLKNVKIPEEVKVIKEEPIPEPEPVVEETPAEENDESGSSDFDKKDKGEVTYSDKPLSELFNEPDFDIYFNGYEVADEYPRPEENELAFSMKAMDDNSFLVMHFNVTNNGSEQILNIIGKKLKIRAIINETNKIQNSKSILLNDFESYYELVGGGETRDTVIVFEVEKSLLNTMTSLDLSIKCDDDTEIYKIY